MLGDLVHLACRGTWSAKSVAVAATEPGGWTSTRATGACDSQCMVPNSHGGSTAAKHRGLLLWVLSGRLGLTCQPEADLQPGTAPRDTLSGLQGVSLL